MLHVRLGKNGYLSFTSRESKVLRAALRNLKQVPLPEAQHQLIELLYTHLEGESKPETRSDVTS